MTRRRWIADEVHGNTAILTGEHAAHLSRVLRAQIGQEFDIATGETVRHGKITSISEDRVEFAVGDEQASKPAPQVTLALAIFKFDRMEWAIEKCTEIGVARIIPVIARRTDAHLAAAAGKRRERWQRLARQAAEQSRRAAPPEIAGPVKLKELEAASRGYSGPATSAAKAANEDAAVTAALKRCATPNQSFSAASEVVHLPTHSAPHSTSDLPSEPAGPIAERRIVLAESEQHTVLRDVLHASIDAVTLAIGPEGGWAEDELQWFRQSGWTVASLGDTILRAETAAVVATALALDALR